MAEQIEREYPYVRKLPLFAIYDVIESLGGQSYYDEDTEVLTVSLSVYGIRSVFSIRLREVAKGTRCTLTITEPNETLTRQGRERALRFMVDAIDQHLETALRGQALPSDLNMVSPQGKETKEKGGYEL